MNPTSNAADSLPSRRYKVFWWLGAIALALASLFLIQRFGPGPPLVLSKQTTGITAPLLANGAPDYEEYVRQKLRANITPENNAAVLLWQAIRPDKVSPADYEAVAIELGLPMPLSPEVALEPTTSEALLQRVTNWLPKPSVAPDAPSTEPNAEALIDLAEAIGAAHTSAWKSNEFPPLADWVAANKAPLDLLVTASRRPRFYSPSPTLLNGRADLLSQMQLPGTEALREAARALATRANLHAGEGQYNEAWDDIIAIYRLAELSTQGFTIIDQLVSIALRGIAYQSTRTLLASPGLPLDVARRVQNDLAALKPFSNCANCIDRCERLCSLDAVCFARAYGFSALSGDTATPRQESPANRGTLNWNIVLEQVNDTYDQLAVAMNRPTYDERKAAIDSFEKSLKQQFNKGPASLVAAFFSRTARSRLVGSTISSFMVPALSAATIAEERDTTLLTLHQLAAALAVYKAEHGAYPTSLENLVPEIIASLPADLYHAQPFVYRLTDDGYLLYSVGGNSIDEGGSSEMMSTFEGRALNDLSPDEADSMRDKIPNKADDFSVRLPTKLFKLPKPRTEQ